MKRILSLVVILVMMLSCEASAIYFFEPVAIEKGYDIGNAELLQCDDNMTLSSREESFEERILAGWESFAEEIDVKDLKIKVKDLGEMYGNVLFSNPLYFYVGREYAYYFIEYANDPDAYVEIIFPQYTTTDYNEISDMLEAIEEEANNILLYVDSGMSDFEKVMAVHDYMVLHYDYDHTLENHTITIMVTKTGVCESYTFAFMYIMDLLGIECAYVSSDEMKHAWNLVKVDGEWYHVDVTWDDMERPDQVGHRFELLSDSRIQSMENPHYGYDTGGRVANSDRFDNADWHENTSQIVSVNGVDYWEKDNDLVDSLGNVIYEDLDGNDGRWSIGEGYSFRGSIYAGLAEFSGMLYFNTDKAIYSYNPAKKETKLIREEEGICGLYIDKNIIRYCKYDREASKFYEAGNMELNGIRYAIPYVKDNMIVAEVFSSVAENVKVMTFGDAGCRNFEIKEGLNTLHIGRDEGEYMFIWNSNLRPLKDKVKLPE